MNSNSLTAERGMMTAPEAAAYLGLKKSYLYKLTHGRRIPHYSPTGGKVYFKKEELDEYLMRGRQYADYELEEQAQAAILKGGRK